ncbi:acetylxylan esterase [Candidatus Laterigemmans baculatus]|uniref:acetylxylan esterase n=1 Tax=Candidatus Laterigemmans baculatus TaxID=2770505 RepID=UPI0013DAA36A|nr:acetylxylan esterase [Candidatus Laterigemmans baculatus]
MKPFVLPSRLLNPSIGRGLCLLVAATLQLTQLQAEDTYQLKVVTEPAEAIYEVGQSARFLVTLLKDGEEVSEGTVSYAIDDFIPDNPPSPEHSSGTVQLSGEAAIEATSSKPGFLLLRASFRTPENQTLVATAAAGFSPLKIQPSLPVPEDFDQFWAEQKAQLARVPMDPKLTPVEQANADVECYDVQLACLGGAPVSGYLAKPKNAAPKSLPAILWVHGAGVRSSSLYAAISGAQANMLSMDINAHGIPNGKPAEYYQDLAAGKLKNYRHEGRESRETSYFRGMYLRLVRAIDFLTSQPEWDGRILAVNGHSQGGGQALVAGGLDDRVTFVASGVPAICDHSGRVAGRINGWPKLVPTGEDGKPDPQILEASRYVDAVNFASRCRADAILSVGFIDQTCPPSSCYAAYNQLTGDKQMINEPLMGHAGPPHIKQAFFERIQQHVKEMQE